MEPTVADVLDALGARTPAPASGYGAALAGAVAAALAELAARFSNDDAATEEAGALRARLLSLGEADSAAYAAFVRTRGDAERQRTIDVPLEIAEAAAAVADIAAELARSGNPNVVGDAEAAVELARATARVGARLVELNLAGADDPRLALARAASTR